MAKNLIFILSFLLFNLVSLYLSKIVVIPFRTNISENNITNISQKFLEKSLYTENLIGTPAQTININIFQNEFSFYLGENKCNKIPLTFYKCSESSTYNESSGLIKDDNFGKGYISQEYFSFYNSINLKSNTSSSNLTFFFKKNYRVTEVEVCADLGLRIKERYTDYDHTSSFIEIVKKKNLTNDYFWSYIYFEKDKNNKIKNINGIDNEYIMKNYEGILIFGETPHEYESNKYNKSDLIYVLAGKRYIELCWDIIFKNIYISLKNDSVINFNDSVQASLDISLNYILAPTSVFENITEYFFKDYLNKNICKFNQINVNSYYNYTVISCNKNDFDINDIKKFPTIFFEHVNYNYTFNLTYEDLFEEFNDSILFLLYSQQYSNWYWRLGKIFLKKYKFIFNQDSKTIGFYRNYNINDKNEDNSSDNEKNTFGFLTNKNFWINFVWIISCIICLGLGVYFGHKYIKKEKKKRINELQDDDYDYSIQNNING